MVFDIDGTLTTSDAELFGDAIVDFFDPFLADFVPNARFYGWETTALRADQGYSMLYLTGRPYWLADITREWLDDLAFPGGTLHTTDNNAEVLPTDAGVGEFKVAYLSHLMALGFVIDGAYGNATTDIYAYEGVSIPKDRTWILGPEGGVSGTVDLGDDFRAHYDVAVTEADPTQPFAYP